MRKQGLYIIVISLLLNCFYPVLIYSQEVAAVTPDQSSPQPDLIIDNVYIDAQEIYETFSKEGQLALAAHKACAEFDAVREVGNAIAESSLDAKTKGLLLAAFTKKLARLEKKVLDRKNSLVQFRKQQRDDALLVILAIFIPGLVGLGLLAFLNRR